MRAKLLYALISTSIAAGTSWTASNAVLDRLPKGETRDAVEDFVLAPGRALADKLDDQKGLRKLRKKGAKKLEEGREQVEEKVEEAVEKISETLEDRDLGGLKDLKGLEELDRVSRLYNVGIWAAAGFVLSFLMTLLFGISSLRSALSLGFKVTLAMIFLQATLVFAGFLAYQRIAG